MLLPAASGIAALPDAPDRAGTRAALCGARRPLDPFAAAVLPAPADMPGVPPPQPASSTPPAIQAATAHTRVRGPVSRRPVSRGPASRRLADCGLVGCGPVSRGLVGRCCVIRGFGWCASASLCRGDRVLAASRMRQEFRVSMPLRRRPHGGGSVLVGYVCVTTVSPGRDASELRPGRSSFGPTSTAAAGVAPGLCLAQPSEVRVVCGQLLIVVVYVVPVGAAHDGAPCITARGRWHAGGSARWCTGGGGRCRSGGGGGTRRATGGRLEAGQPFPAGRVEPAEAAGGPSVVS